METPYQSFTIIGYGNVGKQLAIALNDKGALIERVVSKTHKYDKQLPNTKFTDSINEIPKGSCVIICVPDDCIASYVSQLSDHVLAYTAGGVSIESLPEHKNLGVFYPLQTFSKERYISIENVPFLIESKNDEHAQKLMLTALSLSKNVQFADSEYRKKLHLSAVWINNFTNHIVQRAFSIGEINGINIDLLKPLLEETIEKLKTVSPYEAQTGPAKRQDNKVLAMHLEMLEGSDKEIYKVISESIKKLYSHYE